MTNFGRTWDAKKQLNDINKRADSRVQKNIDDENIAYACQRMGDNNRIMGEFPLQIYQLLSGPIKSVCLVFYL